MFTIRKPYSRYKDFILQRIFADDTQSLKKCTHERTKRTVNDVNIIRLYIRWYHSSNDTKENIKNAYYVTRNAIENEFACTEV